MFLSQHKTKVLYPDGSIYFYTRLSNGIRFYVPQLSLMFFKNSPFVKHITTFFF